MEKQKLGYKIIFLGTPNFAIPSLQALIKANLKPFLVVTQPDKPVGRNQRLTPPPIKEFALKYEIKIVQPMNKKELIKIFNSFDVDVCILVAYGMIIPKEILSKPKFGFLNVHPSLLPKYRGPSPIQFALLNRETITGVTIMKLDDKMDTGPILKQQETLITPEDTAESLHNKLSSLGADLLIRVLPDYLQNKIKLIPQNDSMATYSKIIKREDGRINWSKSTEEITGQFKAFSPWPGVFTYLGDKRLKITNLQPLEGVIEDKLVFGEVFLSPAKELAVRCKNGAVLLKSVWLEGKKEVLAKDFLIGHQNLVGQILN